MLPAAAQQLNYGQKASITSVFTPRTSSQSVPHFHAPRKAEQRCCQPAAAVSPGQPQQAPNLSHSRSCSQYQHQTACSSQNSSWWSRLDWELLLLVSAMPVPAAIAEEGLAYDSSKGEGIVKTLSGAFYIGILLYFLFKVLNRRARKAREERLAGQGPVRTIFTGLIEQMTEGKERPQATAGAAFIGAVQAGLIGYGLFMFASRVEGMVYSGDLPAGYTARNVAITVRTIIVGLMYLATFTFSANALGLAGLSIQLLLFPDSLPDEASPASRVPKEPQLPKVTVTSSREDIKAAFEAVARAQQSKTGVTPSSSSSSTSAQVSGFSGSSSSSSSSSSSTESNVAAADRSDGSSSRAMAGASGSNDSS